MAIPLRYVGSATWKNALSPRGIVDHFEKGEQVGQPYIYWTVPVTFRPKNCDWCSRLRTKATETRRVQLDARQKTVTHMARPWSIQKLMPPKSDSPLI